MSIFKKLTFVFCILLGIFSILPSSLQAQDLSGFWSVNFVTGSSSTDTHSWTLLQRVTEGVPAIYGTGQDATNSWHISATYTGITLSLIYTFTSSNYLVIFEGDIIDGSTLTGTWIDSNAISGTWSANKLSIPSVPVTPALIIQDPPAVVIEKSTATLLLKKFSGVGNIKTKALQVQTAAIAKLNFRYAVEVSRTKDTNGKTVKNEIIRKTTKKNQLALKGLKPGQYSAKYKVEITKKQGSIDIVVGKTKSSPSAVFNVTN